ncbi:MAG: RluA family pseudouridine synthase [Bacteroidota bacterium]
MKRKPIEILHEDNHLIVVNKDFCVLSQGDITREASAFDLVKDYIRVTYNKPGNIYLALIHRLDRPTGGILLLAKTSKAAGRLSQQFHDRKVEKTYWAITEGIPQENQARLRHFHKQMERKNRVQLFPRQVSGSKEAVLDYQLLQKNGRRSLFEVYPKTGRKHQIRVQLSSLACPIVGDLKYGASAPNPDKSICLLAKKLTFTHPTKKEPMTIEAPLPRYGAWKAFASLDPH